MTTEDVKLLSAWPSPYGMRARIALQAKGVKYELLEQNLIDKSKLLLESNPIYKKIPVLLVNGKAIVESLIIVLYIDEAWPENEARPGFLPKDPYERATAHFWTAFIDKKIFDVALGIRWLKGEEKEAAIKDLYENLTTLESVFAKLGANPFFNGTTLGYMDIALAPFAAWLPVLVQIRGIRVPTVEEAPHLHKYFSAIREHPASEGVFPDQEKLVSFSHALSQYLGIPL